MFYFATSAQLLLPHTENIAVEGETDFEFRLVVAGEVGLDGGHCKQGKKTSRSDKDWWQESATLQIRKLHQIG